MIPRVIFTCISCYLPPENDKLESIILNKNNFESFLRDLLLVKSYRVEVYCNKPTAKGSASWVLEFKVSFKTISVCSKLSCNTTSIPEAYFLYDDFELSTNHCN